MPTRSFEVSDEQHTLHGNSLNATRMQRANNHPTHSDEVELAMQRTEHAAKSVFWHDRGSTGGGQQHSTVAVSGCSCSCSGSVECFDSHQCAFLSTCAWCKWETPQTKLKFWWYNLRKPGYCLWNIAWSGETCPANLFSLCQSNPSWCWSCSVFPTTARCGVSQFVHMSGIVLLRRH